MNFIRKAWRRLTTPHKNSLQEDLKILDEKVDQQGSEMRAQGAELERRAHEQALAYKPNLTDDPQTDVPAFHPGVVSRLDVTTPVRRGEPVPEFREQLRPSDWELLSPEEKALFEQITPHDESKAVRYPAPVELTTADWVTEQLTKAGFSQAYNARFAGWRRVAIGMSMRHLADLKRRAEARDTTMSVHDLIALRSRGIA